MRLSLLTIHPQIFSGFISEGLIAKATQKNLIQFDIQNIRDYSDAPHHRVDDKSYGGGPGMVLMCEPIVRALRACRSTENPKKTRTILLAAKGKKFTQKVAHRLSKYDQLVFICGRYEGVDERIAEHYIDEEIRIGDYVMMGGEVASMVMIEAIVRLLPGVLGNPLSTQDESFSSAMVEEYGQYTRPREFEGHLVPEVLVRGNHREIEKWRSEKSKKKK